MAVVIGIISAPNILAMGTRNHVRKGYLFVWRRLDYNIGRLVIVDAKAQAKNTIEEMLGR